MSRVEGLSRRGPLSLAAVLVVVAAVILLRAEGAQPKLPSGSVARPALDDSTETNAIKSAALAGAAQGVGILQMQPIQSRNQTVGWAVRARADVGCVDQWTALSADQRDHSTALFEAGGQLPRSLEQRSFG